MIITPREAMDKVMAIPYDDGRIFSVLFVKKDGTARKMTCRRGVKKGVTGKGLAYKPSERALLPVYDMEKKGFRMINAKTLISLTIGGERFTVMENKGA